MLGLQSRMVGNKRTQPQREKSDETGHDIGADCVYCAVCREGGGGGNWNQMRSSDE